MNELYQLNNVVTEFYHKELYKHDEAISYLKQRNINSDTIESFNLGYASENDSIHNYLKEQGYSDEIIEESKLCLKNEEGKFVDRLKNRIIIPIYNEENRIVGFGARTIGNALPKYINNPENQIYSKYKNLFGLNKAKEHIKDGLILVEGYMDLIALYQAGVKNVVSILGTTISTSQVELMKKYTDTVYIVFDNDEAGINATSRVIEILKSENLNVKVVELKQAKDPEEYLRKYGVQSFNELISNSISPV